MLTNGNFELDWGAGSSHRCLIIPSGGEPYITDVGNIFTPSGGWMTWFFHVPDTWGQPEVRDAWRQNDPRRVHSGEKAMLLFTFNRRHDAGFYQQVQVEPGTRLRLSAWAHAWSNHRDDTRPGAFPHPDDPCWSEGAGYEQIRWSVVDIPPLNNDPQNDAMGNFAFRVGIDPTGGNNPFAATVKWGDQAFIYNGHQQVFPVEVVAQAETVTVFLRSTTRWPFKHNDAYWDDVVLEVVEEKPEPDCYGLPRVQYERTYVLLPPDANVALAQAVAEATWDKERWTIGGSADDAGIGDLGTKRVIAIDPQDWPGDLQAFYEEHYPGTEYWPIDSGNWYQLAGRLLALSLRESGFSLAYPTTHVPPHITDDFGVWRGTLFHNGLDLRASWAVWRDNVLSATNGVVTVAGVNATEPWFGIQVRVRTATTDGRRVLLRYAHLASTPVQVGDNVTVGQVIGRPDSTGQSTADHLHVDVIEGDSYADPELLIVWPEDVPEPEPTQESISLHLQRRVAGDAEFLRAVEPNTLKLVLNIGEARHVKAASPDTLVVYRHWTPDQGQYWNNPNPDAGARAYLDSFLPELLENAQYIDYVESLNELVASSDTAGIERTVAFDIAFCEALADVGYPARPIVLIVAVGNPHHGNETRLLIPAVRVAIIAGGALGYHAYYGARPGYCTMDDAWQHYAGRALESWDPEFRAAGLYPKYFFGECGAVAISTGGAMNAGAGWKHPTCLGGDWGLYLAQILEFRRRLMEWNATHGNRVLGATLFTTGGGEEWKYFEIGTAEMAALAEALR